jgi:hypothetical protein
MSIQNVSPAAGLQQVSEGVGLPPVKAELVVTTETKQVSEQGGSTGSHLLFGLGTLVFLSPMLIPGIPMNWLAAGYLAWFVVVVTGAVFWAGIRAVSSRSRRSRHRHLRS